MILDLRGYDSFPVSIRLSADPADKTMFSTDQMRVESLTMDLDIQESAGEYYCQGKVAATGKIECVRCLMSFSCELEYETNFTVRENDKESSRDTQEVFDDEETLSFVGRGLTVDVTDQVRQAVLLAETVHPLCAPNCKGLCSSCGANLNQRDCQCSHDHIDSRWDGLKSLKDLR